MKPSYNARKLNRRRGWLLPTAKRIGAIQLATGALTLVALLFWGEGWHNNHHAKPRNWDFRLRWWEFDVGAWIVRLVRAG